MNFIAPNPVTSFNPLPVYPHIHPTAYIGPFATIIGDVTIGRNVFVAPSAVLRADEGTPFFIGRNTNIQDSVIFHGLLQGRVLVNNKEYSIYVGRGVTCAHGCIIHGPCALEDGVFVGFHSIVFHAAVGKGSYISANAIVAGGVKIAPGRFVPIGAVIDTQEKADALGSVPQAQQEFAEQVQELNVVFSEVYPQTFGAPHCSCGL